MQARGILVKEDEQCGKRGNIQRRAYSTRNPDAIHPPYRENLGSLLTTTTQMIHATLRLGFHVFQDTIGVNIRKSNSQNFFFGQGFNHDLHFNSPFSTSINRSPYRAANHSHNSAKFQLLFSKPHQSSRTQWT